MTSSHAETNHRYEVQRWRVRDLSLTPGFDTFCFGVVGVN